ncbi:TIGR02234 family membrane protein [Nocardia harenae]|uniref:TIGR02234 family membrane protein n=1 Tax=Nocardia harenae TaxID=358707 RepID=UPI001FE0A18A|nr:TIGR02234 family membrane protein [Nocardia harenae]
MASDVGGRAVGVRGRRRFPVGPVLLLAVAAGLMWVASRMTWVTVTSSDGLTEPRTDELAGGTWFGALTPLALVLLAAIAAVFAARGWLRRLLGVLVTLVAAVTAVPPFALLTDSGDPGQRGATLAELPGRAEVTGVQTAVFPAVLALAAALAAFAAGVLLARMPRESAELSGRYDVPAVRRAAAGAELDKARSGEDAELTERVLWDAIDAGADPTADPAPRDPAAPPTGADGDRPRGGGAE